jgi:signal transduction histidine kinase
VTTPSVLQQAGLRLPPWMGSIRFRIALLTSAALFFVAAVLIGALYLGLSLTLQRGPVSEEVLYAPVTVDEFGLLREEQPIELADVRDLERRMNEHTLATMRNISLGALGVLFVVSLAIGWVVAGRTLQPIDRITAVAREIQATNLSRRIALEGPDDELKRLADTFDAMLGRIDAAFSAQRRFIADASHELRNPLAIIGTNLDVAFTEPDATPEALRNQLLVVRRAADRMAAIVRDLLSLARLETPAYLQSEADLAAIAAEAGQEFDALAEQRGVRIERRLEPRLLILGDRDAIKRAIANLLDNAVRHAPPGSRIQLVSTRERDWVSVAVRDEGPGLAPEEQARVFDRFWRADRSRPGGGLGLAIVKQTVESHGGTVLLSSAPGAGSTFYVCLPAAAVPAAA